MTLKEIREFMLSRLGPPVNDGSDYYDEDGHCGDKLYDEIVSFWEDFNKDEDFYYLVFGTFENELDLHGGRSYLLPEEELAPMCFEYLVSKGFTAERFSKLVFNSNELNELIEELFESKSYIRDIKINEVLKEETTPINIWSSYNFETPEKHTFIDWIRKLNKV
jgi:hypothetical protein